jgi:hypothetical protein
MKAIQRLLGVPLGLSRGIVPPSLGTPWSICKTHQCGLVRAEGPEHLQGYQLSWQGRDLNSTRGLRFQKHASG